MFAVNGVSKCDQKILLPHMSSVHTLDVLQRKTLTLDAMPCLRQFKMVAENRPKGSDCYRL